jgi:hypothetical protein
LLTKLSEEPKQFSFMLGFRLKNRLEYKRGWSERGFFSVNSGDAH